VKTIKSGALSSHLFIVRARNVNTRFSLLFASNFVTLGRRRRKRPSPAHTERKINSQLQHASSDSGTGYVQHTRCMQLLSSLRTQTSSRSLAQTMTKQTREWFAYLFFSATPEGMQAFLEGHSSPGANDDTTSSFDHPLIIFLHWHRQRETPCFFSVP
jgi:hypothetical protein